MKKIILLFLSLYSAFSFASTDTPLKKLTVVLDWAPNPNHAPMMVAKQQGFFKAEGLDVTFVKPERATDPTKMVVDGRADIALVYGPWYMESVDQGLPIIVIGTLIDKPLSCMVALKRSGIHSPADLKNKQIGATSNSITHASLALMMQKHGISKDDIKLIKVRDNLTQALLSKKVDVITGMMRNVEVPILEADGHKLEVFFPEENGVPVYSELVLVSHINKAKDDRFPRFLDALKDGVAYLDSHPNETWDQFAKDYPEANNKANHASWLATLPYFAEDPMSFDEEEWTAFAKFMKENKLIADVQPASRYAVTLNGAA